MTQNIYNGDAPLYDAINGNKRHIAVNTRTAEGMGVLWKLLETADIFICHMREKDMVKLGIDWDTLHAKFPALIYANTTGYGSTGPLASRGGFDMIAYATRTGLTTDVVPEARIPTCPTRRRATSPRACTCPSASWPRTSTACARAWATRCRAACTAPA